MLIKKDSADVKKIGEQNCNVWEKYKNLILSQLVRGLC